MALGMHAVAGERVVYNGHAYTLLWRGQTKFGRRAHLAYLDGSKDFWVDEAKLGGDLAGRSGMDAATAREYRVHECSCGRRSGIWWSGTEWLCQNCM
jgi:hypothetical protein